MIEPAAQSMCKLYKPGKELEGFAKVPVTDIKSSENLCDAATINLITIFHNLLPLFCIAEASFLTFWMGFGDGILEINTPSSRTSLLREIS